MKHLEGLTMNKRISLVLGLFFLTPAPVAATADPQQDQDACMLDGQSPPYLARLSHGIEAFQIVSIRRIRSREDITTAATFGSAAGAFWRGRLAAP
jgi:hypothetical protein